MPKSVLWLVLVSSPTRMLFICSMTDRRSSTIFRYDIFAINIASTMLGYVYGAQQKLNKQQDLGIKVATPVGTLVGQLLFGWLADVLGRKKMCTFGYLPSDKSRC